MARGSQTGPRGPVRNPGRALPLRGRALQLGGALSARGAGVLLHPRVQVTETSETIQRTGKYTQKEQGPTSARAHIMLVNNQEGGCKRTEVLP